MVSIADLHCSVDMQSAPRRVRGEGRIVFQKAFLLFVDHIFDVFFGFVFLHKFGGSPDLFLHGVVRLRIDGLGLFDVAAHLLFKLFDDFREGDAHIVADSFRVEGEALAV